MPYGVLPSPIFTLGWAMEAYEDVFLITVELIKMKVNDALLREASINYKDIKKDIVH